LPWHERFHPREKLAFVRRLGVLTVVCVVYTELVHVFLGR